MLENKIRFSRKVVAMFLVMTILLLGVVAPANAIDEYQGLRERWNTYLIGLSDNGKDKDIKAELDNITLIANNSWNTLNKDSSRTYLWSDLADWKRSSTITKSYKRLESMAIAYRTSGSSLYGSSELAEDIIGGLDWIYANHYNPSLNEIDNWWDWEIGAPQLLNNIIVLMYKELSQEQIENYISGIDKWCPNAKNRVINNAAETGANRADKAQVLIIRGIVGKSGDKIAEGRDALSEIFTYVTSGDGYYTDGSFIQHNNIPYTGGYGYVLLNDMAKLLYLLNGSTWTVTDPNVKNVYEWVTDSYQSLIYKGAMMDIVHGRGISRQAEQEHNIGRNIISVISLLAESAPTDKAANFKSMVKSWIQSDITFNNYYTEYSEGTSAVSGLPISVYQTQLLKSIMQDSSINPSKELVKTQVFAMMDRVVHLRPGFGFGLSMFSNRTSAFEYGNGENIDGWWYGVGRTNLYNNDLNQYSNSNWATINRYRLPGITTDGTGSGTPIAWKSYPNTSNWVGGSAVEGLYSSAGMEFSLVENTGSPLQGKKSWFMFSDKIVALGAGITNTNDKNVETIVENRKLNKYGNNLLTVNGVSKSKELGWTENMTKVQWAHLAGDVKGTDIGYYFPETAIVNGLRESRTGTWSATNTGQGKTEYRNNYLSLALGHGVNPKDATYAYTVLPNKSVDEMKKYAENPDINILENSNDVQAVKDLSLNAVGANFWNDGNKTVSVNGKNFITSDKKASVTTLETSNDIAIGVADPTQLNNGRVNIEINRSASGIVSLDPDVTVTQFSPTIKMSINVKGAAGKTFNAKFNLGSPIKLNKPTLSNAIKNDSQVTLNWKSVGGETGYKIRYGTKPGSYTNEINVNNVSNDNNYAITGLVNGQTYYFTIYAINCASKSSNSNELNAIPNIQINPHVTFTTSDDSYARDGSYARNNFGTVNSMTVKADNEGYNRCALMKFDLSEITGKVTSAKVQLMPVTVGMPGIVNEARLISDNAWSETTINWNNKPDVNTILSKWTVSKIGTVVEFDVTKEVIAALGKDKKLSIGVSAPTNQGSNATVSYGTKENASASYRPVIIIN